MLIRNAGENALLVYLAKQGEQPSPTVSARVQALVEALPQALGALLLDMIPSYTSVLVLYDATALDAITLRRRLRELVEGLASKPAPPGRVVELPAWYAPEAGADLESLAAHARISTDELIAVHSGTEYRVYAIGFAPGFAYLGEVDARIAAPRLPSPRAQVPRGSIGIADRQTAVYPTASPGGWNLIGRCPLRLFDPSAIPCMPLAVGDRVRFRPIGREEYLALGGEP
ncbi:MAG: 5-oxoprolinase subunit PxpB [Lamprobacter sp.]|uniref:5-oxoprolinase subunit PxpB n=1 Tax=Lamprobacter sp. TaxID=3100796 RepID=UPI002B25E804|nr:5-oxoprolinase subunit PxpB [Lamprobacter sp.]MEA3644140.1 5-oxoprolinase subunit PxpB [Lamprobacter sp.]